MVWSQTRSISCGDQFGSGVQIQRASRGFEELSEMS
jgi:hypothetical protein